MLGSERTIHSFVCRWAWRRGNRDSSGRVGPCTKYACRTIEEDTLGLACMLDRRSVFRILPKAYGRSIVPRFVAKKVGTHAHKAVD